MAYIYIFFEIIWTFGEGVVACDIYVFFSRGVDQNTLHPVFCFHLFLKDFH